LYPAGSFVADPTPQGKAADLGNGKQDLEKTVAVGHQHGHPVPLFQAHFLKSIGRLIDTPVKFLLG
jgi:hypothetical protein